MHDITGKSIIYYIYSNKKSICQYVLMICLLDIFRTSCMGYDVHSRANTQLQAGNTLLRDDRVINYIKHHVIMSVLVSEWKLKLTLMFA